MRKLKIINILHIIIVLICLLINTISIYAFKNVKKGDKALTFTANKVEGDSFTLDTALGKKPIVLFFWKLDLGKASKEGEASGKDYDASTKWIQEITLLQKMVDKYKSDGLEVIGITSPVKAIYDKQNNIVRNPDFAFGETTDIKNFLKEKEINFTIILDEGLKIYNSYGIIPYPSTAVIDKQGMIIFELSSFPTFGGESMIENNIKNAISGVNQSTSANATCDAKYIPKGKADTFYKNAVGSMDKNKIDKATEELKSAIKEDPNYPEPHKMLAKIYKEKKDTQNAMMEYITILELEPCDPKNHILYADFSFENNMVEDAKKEYEIAIKSDTTGVPYIGRMGEPRFRVKKVASGDGYYGLGMIALKQNKKDEAFEYFTKAISFMEGSAEGGDMNSEFSKKKEIQPNLPKTHYELGMLYLDKGEEDKAIKEFKEGISAYQIIIKKILKQKWY